MPDERPPQDLSLDDIFSRLRKEDKGKGKAIGVPFKFLDSYTIEDRNIFFGRDNEIEDIFRKLYDKKVDSAFSNIDRALDKLESSYKV